MTLPFGKLARMLAVVLLAVTATAEARYVGKARVRYATQEGTSQWYDVQPAFLLGSELNEATRTWNYAPFNSYVVVFWQPEEATVIKVTDLIICGQEFTESCLPILGRVKGSDQQGRTWEVCTGLIC